jgi:hypothetical protein
VARAAPAPPPAVAKPETSTLRLAIDAGHDGGRKLLLIQVPERRGQVVDWQGLQVRLGRFSYRVRGQWPGESPLCIRTTQFVDADGQRLTHFVLDPAGPPSSDQVIVTDARGLDVTLKLITPGMVQPTSDALCF